jgi:hypothetical protein
VDERAHLHELDGGGDVDDIVVEHAADRGRHDREQGSQPLPAGAGHRRRVPAEQGVVPAERVGDAVVDRSEPGPEVVDAEKRPQPPGGQVDCGRVGDRL